jgi:hypothetical protein
MDYEITDEGLVSLQADADEVLTLTHCVIEALEALSETEFLIRTGGSKVQAEQLLTTLKRVSAELPRHGEP